jgi:hypothetical protein
MNSKLNSIVISSLIIAFAIIAGIPTVFENILAQQEN